MASARARHNLQSAITLGAIMAAQNLRIPGPVPMPDSVRAALANQMINHRGSEFKLLLGEVRARLGSIFATQSEILCFTSSGTGGLEAAIVNLFSPGVGALPFETDAWGIDVVVTASQKAFGCPPGLTMISVSPKAWEAVARSRMPRFYWDFQKLREAHKEGSTPFTPAVSVFYGLSAALDLMEQEGAAARFARHQRAGELVRNGVLDMGLGLFADPPHNSNIVTAVTMPEGISPKDVREELRARYNTVVAGGPERLKDSIIRIAHMGFFVEEDLTTTLEQLDTVVKSLK